MELSKEQKYAFNKYVDGENLFITGPGGAGKSALIRYIYNDACINGKRIQVTALTGCAAILLNCRAKTIHSWAGIGLGKNSNDYYIQKIKKNKFFKKSWRETDILIIDEVSMLSLKLFDLLNSIGKAVRLNQRPFGGIQLIFSGDFYQLPPVGDSMDADTQKFCFESADWYNVFRLESQIQLIKIFRQTDDVYSSILNQIREGKIKRKSNELLATYVGREVSPDIVVEPTKLFPTKNRVEQINNLRISELEGEERVFKINYLKNIEINKSEKDLRESFTNLDIKNEVEFLAENIMCEKEVKIKIGAQVMCIVNIKSDTGSISICNGSQGIVTSFCSVTGFPNVKYNNGIEMVMMPHIWQSDKIPGVGISQVPLILSWALTIHKSQGSTLDAAEIDVGSGIFECGQTYVALSRVKNLDGLYLTSFDVSRIKINKKVRDYYESLDLYYKSKEGLQEEQISEQQTQVQQIPEDSISNRFIKYRYDPTYPYVSEKSELKPDAYDEIKIIKLY